MDHPAVGGLLGHAQLAAIEQVQRRLDRVADLALGVEADPLAVRERGLDHARQIVVLHEPCLSNERSGIPAGRRVSTTGACRRASRHYRRGSSSPPPDSTACRLDPSHCPTDFLDRCADDRRARAACSVHRTTGHPTRSTSGATSTDWRQRSPARARPRRSRRSWRWRPAAGVAIVPQGGNTGLVGGGIPDHSGRQLVLSLTGLDRVRAVDPRGEWLVAEAGCTLAAVQAAAEGAGRLFPLSLGSEGTCQIGGNLSSNAGGVSVIRYGMARELVLGPRGGAGRRQGLERPAHAAQGQYRLRPEAGLPGGGGQPRDHHRRLAAAVRPATGASDAVRGRAVPRGRPSRS